MKSESGGGNNVNRRKTLKQTLGGVKEPARKEKVHGRRTKGPKRKINFKAKRRP